MRQRLQKSALVISGREITILVIALAILMLAAFLFVFGVTRLNDRSVVSSTATLQTPVVSTPPLATATLSPPVTPTLSLAPAGQPTPDRFEHVVQPGETLSSIATFYGIALPDLLRINSMTLDTIIREGQSIIIPLPPSRAGRWHIVQPGDSLSGIAAYYGVDPELIRTTNHLSDADTIFVGQRLRIPLVPPEGATPEPADILPTAGAVETLPPMPGSSRIYATNWPRSLLEGDLSTNYPLTYTGTRFTVHYQPDTYASHHLDETVQLAGRALEHIEATLNVRLEGTFDIYLAGTLFASPNAYLHGLSRSAERRVFILHDGSGTDTDNLYFFIHEITHLVAWNTWGAPSSTMLSEGLATYTGRTVLEGGGYLPYDELCASTYTAGLMPLMSSIERDWQAFLGHIRDPLNYFGSACFVGYLIDTYGLEAMSRLYHTSDYTGIYGRSLDELDADWRSVLAARAASLTLDPAEMVAYTEEVGETFEFVVNNFNNTPVMYQAYAAVDQARIALWQGNYPEVRRWLDTVYEVIGYRP